MRIVPVAVVLALAAGSRAAEPPKAAPAPQKATREATIAEFQAAVIKASGCDKDDEDAEELAPDLKDKFALVSCEGRAGLREILLGPKETIPGRQLEFGSIKDGKATIELRGARFFGHYLVLEFEGQTQYLDLLKPQPDGEGFAAAGFVSQGTAVRFEDVAPFADALRLYMSIASSDSDAAAADDISARLPDLVGGQKYRLTGSFSARGELIVVAKTGGRSIKLWPTSVRRVRK